MSRRVAVLPDGVVNQIAAGEVVERPASVVKELVENALDAGATSIEIVVEGAGTERIAVSDDGEGMTREDALTAFERHATSKISGAGDLEGIRTLGFRGEALPSIAAVGRVTLETATGSSEGTRIRIEGGRRKGVEAVARARGTTVDVRHLFYNTPARRSFLRSRATERAHVVRAIVENALVRPAVAWRATHGGRAIVDLPPARSLEERLAALYDPAYLDGLVPIHARIGGVGLHGFAQRPAAAGASRRRQHVFVDGRPVDAPEAVRAAIRGYRSTLPPRARPDVFLFLDLESGLVDVNVHPTKREVRFRDAPAIAEAIETAVREALGAGSGVARPLGRARRAEPSRAGGRAGEGRQLALFRPVDARPVATGRRREAADARPGTSAVRERPDREGREPVEFAPALWQLHDRFILARTASGLAIVDQHSAHERILYEEVVDDLREGARAGQRLLFPLVLHLTPEQHATWEEYQGLIDRLGFEIEPFGGHAIAVSAAPAFRHAFDAEDALAGLLDDLARPGGGSADMNQHERVARLFACKAAIKAGTRLGEEEMAELIDRLFRTRLPYDDVHGRPAILAVSIEDLERHFGRH